MVWAIRVAVLLILASLIEVALGQMPGAASSSGSPRFALGAYHGFGNMVLESDGSADLVGTESGAFAKLYYFPLSALGLYFEAGANKGLHEMQQAVDGSDETATIKMDATYAQVAGGVAINLGPRLGVRVGGGYDLGLKGALAIDVPELENGPFTMGSNTRTTVQAEVNYKLLGPITVGFRYSTRKGQLVVSDSQGDTQYTYSGVGYQACLSLEI